MKYFTLMNDVILNQFFGCCHFYLAVLTTWRRTKSGSLYKDSWCKLMYSIVQHHNTFSCQPLLKISIPKKECNNNVLSCIKSLLHLIVFFLHPLLFHRIMNKWACHHKMDDLTISTPGIFKSLLHLIVFFLHPLLFHRIMNKWACHHKMDDLTISTPGIFKRKKTKAFFIPLSENKTLKVTTTEIFR